MKVRPRLSTASQVKKDPHGWRALIGRPALVAYFWIALLVAVSCIGYIIWQNHLQALEVDQNATAVKAAKAHPKNQKDQEAAEGKDTAALPSYALASYKVAADAPRALYIPSLTIAARILPMGVNPDNSIQAPININDSGWYTASAKPGQAGALLIDGHASETGTHYGLFGYLNTIKVGEQIKIQRGDGITYTYQVVHTETVALDNVNMTQLLSPYQPNTQGLNLITCTGAWITNDTTLNQRVIVFAERTS